MNMMINISLLLFFSLLTSFSHLSYSNSINNYQKFSAQAVYLFGDSIFDAGNNHFINNCSVQADFFPYGFNFFHHPTGRFTNGRTVPDFIAQFLGLDLQEPYRHLIMEINNGSKKDYPSNGVNFASAGSGILRDTNKNMAVTPLQVQVQQFEELLHQNHIDKNCIQNSLILFESGSNDIFTYFVPSKNPKPNPNSYIQAMLVEIENFITQIYQLGARRVAIFGLGPIGCIPARAILPQAPLTKCFGKMNKMAKDYNFGLENLVHDLFTKYTGMVATYGAVYTVVQQLRKTPHRYGFIEISSACCGTGPLRGIKQCGKEGYKLCHNPNDFLFWDYFHPSERTYNLIAKALWNGRQQQIRPINLKTLASVIPPPAFN